jgi:hypothetical protein
VNNLANGLFAIFSNAKHKDKRVVEAAVNKLYDAAMPEVGLDGFFAALWKAVAKATGDDDMPFFKTSKSSHATSYPDWHYLAAHSMEVALSSGNASAPSDLLRFFGSRPDWSFFVHGASWTYLMFSYRRGEIRFSDHNALSEASGNGSVQLFVDPRFESSMNHLCPTSLFVGQEPMPPWVSECLHGFGHGAFIAAVESLADAKKPVSFDEVVKLCYQHDDT